MTVHDAMLGSAYADRWRPGLRARRNQDRTRIRKARETPVSGSIDIDEAALNNHQNANRWDYLFGIENGVGSRAVFAEVHAVAIDKADRIIRKKEWLDGFINDELPGLPANREFYWVATSGVGIRPGSPTSKRLAKKGIRVVGTLTL